MFNVFRACTVLVVLLCDCERAAAIVDLVSFEFSV